MLANTLFNIYSLFCTRKSLKFSINHTRNNGSTLSPSKKFIALLLQLTWYCILATASSSSDHYAVPFLLVCLVLSWPLQMFVLKDWQIAKWSAVATWHVRPLLIAEFALCGGEDNEIIGISQYFNKWNLSFWSNYFFKPFFSWLFLLSDKVR